MANDEHLMRFLLDAGLLPHAKLEELRLRAAHSGGTYLQALTESGMMGEDEARRAFAKSLGIPFVSLNSSDIEKDALQEIPEALCRANGLFAYQVEGDRLLLAMLDLDALEKIQMLRLPYSIVPHLTDRQTIKRGLLKYQDLLKELLPKKINEHISNGISDEQKAIHIVDSILEHALRQQAFDIHIEPKQDGLLVQHRVGGKLYDALHLPAQSARHVIARIKGLAKLDQKSTAPQAGRFKIELAPNADSEQISFGVSTLPQSGEEPSEKVVINIARDKMGRNGFTLESLGFHGKGLEALHHMLGKPGLILVSGESRGGVTTLLYTLLDQLIEPTRSAVTVEDNVELQLRGVLQAEAKLHEGVTLAARLKAAVKTDPDIILVSSMKNQDVAAIAMHSANRGMHVLSSMEGRSANTSLSELSEKVDSRLFASILRGAVQTRLVRKLCSKQEKTKLTHDEIEELEASGADLQKILVALKEEGHLEQSAQWKDVVFGRALTCPECEDGYTGSVGVQEIVLPTLSFKEWLASGGGDGDPVADPEQLSLLEDGVFKAALGLTSIEEVLGM